MPKSLGMQYSVVATAGHSTEMVTLPCYHVTATSHWFVTGVCGGATVCAVPSDQAASRQGTRRQRHERGEIFTQRGQTDSTDG